MTDALVKDRVQLLKVLNTHELENYVLNRVEKVEKEKG
jgi:hypothetical protein